MAHLLTRNSRVEEDLVDQLFNSSEKRLARTLLLLANFGKEGGPQPITTPISQETLAEIVGTTRPRVSYFMNKFRKLGFIEYNGHLQVHSSLLSVCCATDQSAPGACGASSLLVIGDQTPSWQGRPWRRSIAAGSHSRGSRRGAKSCWNSSHR